MNVFHSQLKKSSISVAVTVANHRKQACYKTKYCFLNVNKTRNKVEIPPSLVYNMTRN